MPISTSTDSMSCLPSLSEIADFSTVPTLRHVPKGARDSWASLLSDVLALVVDNPSDVDGWSKLLMLPKCILFSPRKSSIYWREIMHIVRQRIRRWVSGDYCGLWSEVCKVAECFRPSQRKGGGKETSSLHLNNANRARRAVEDGQYRKAIQFLTSDGFASVSDNVYSEMV